MMALYFLFKNETMCYFKKDNFNEIWFKYYCISKGILKSIICKISLIFENKNIHHDSGTNFAVRFVFFHNIFSFKLLSIKSFSEIYKSKLWVIKI